VPFQFRNSADSADLTTWSPTDSTVLEWLLYCDRGSAGAGPALSWLYLEVEDPDNPGTWLTSGHPLIDAGEVYARVIGYLNPGGDTAFTPILTGWVRLNLATGSVLTFPAWRGDCAVRCETKVVPVIGTTGAQVAATYRLSVGEGAPPAAALPLLGGDGILTGVGDASLTGWVDWFEITASGTPDDLLNWVAHRWIEQGLLRQEAADTLAVSQDDGDSATLGSGEEYRALLTQTAGGGGFTLTKGSKAGTGLALWPAQPAGEPLAARVVVPYGAAGTVLTASEITSVVVADRFEVRAGAGLTAIVGTGRGILARQWVARETETTLTLNASVTRYVYLAPNGDLSQETTLVAPSLGARPLAEVTTDGSGVTGIVDLRDSWLEPRAERLRLYDHGTEGTGTDIDRLMVDRPCCVDRGTLTLRTASSGGATGSTDVTIVRTRAGTPADVATGSIAAGGYSGGLVWTDVGLQAGDYLSLDVDAITSGGSQGADLAVSIVACPA
jgi:hypothetical protein